MYTFQDFEKQTDKVTFARKLIDYHKSTDIYNTAKNANAYDKQKISQSTNTSRKSIQ